ncbi:MAG: class I SAM-dependent methyltransferase [Nitrospirae bacterium YQR-1]
MTSATDKTCPVCNGVYGLCTLKGLLKCASCGFITADLNLSDYDFKALYGPDYFHGNEYVNYTLEKRTIQKNFRLRLELLLKYVEHSDRKSLFEIGSAYGYFLEPAQGKFKSVAGIDISEDAVRHCREHYGYNVASGDFLDYQMKTGYDVFCMWDTIEHMSEPWKAIEKISTHISPEGVLAITTSDIESVNAKLRGNSWRQIHPPTHLHYFSAKTLTRLLQRHGFTTVYVGYPGYYRSLDMLFYKTLTAKHKLHSLYNLIKHTGLQNLDFYLNLYDIIYVIAKKQ